MNSAAVTLPLASATLHQPNHGELRLFSQNATNSPPSKSLTNSPNSRTV